MSLVPRVFRDPDTTTDEAARCTMFRNQARVLCPSPPARDDLGGWLVLAQHYGLPTRLLDWSESPLTALFFALNDPVHTTGPAILWALWAGRTNAAHGYPHGSPSLDNIAVAELCAPAFDRALPVLDRTLAICREHTDLRHLVQLAAFTIHGSPTPLEHHPESSTFLARIVIPEAHRLTFAQMLWLLRVHRSTLFPDLQNLASYLAGLKLVRSTVPHPGPTPAGKRDTAADRLPPPPPPLGSASPPVSPA